MQQIEAVHKFDNNTKIVFAVDINLYMIRKKFIEKNIPMRDIKSFDNYNFWLCDEIDQQGNVFQLKKRKTNKQ